VVIRVTGTYGRKLQIGNIFFGKGYEIYLLRDGDFVYIGWRARKR